MGHPAKSKDMETLGQKLKAARLKKKLTASEAAKGTRIKIQHIEAIEQDDFSAVPAPAYAKGFIRIYADYLELDPEPLVDEYMEKHAPRQRASLLPDEETQAASEREKEKKPVQWPKLPPFPKIPWDRLKQIKWPAIAWPKMRLPSLPPRLLAGYTAGILVLLLLIVTVARCVRGGDEPPALPVVEDAATEPAGSADKAPPVPLNEPLPVVDELPEPYME